MQKFSKMTETMARGYSSENTQEQEVSNEYQHSRVSIFFKNLCILVLCTKVALALGGLRPQQIIQLHRSIPSVAVAYERNRFLPSL